MAEGFLFNIIEKLICKVGSLVAENWRMKDDLEKLMVNMTEIKAVVLDAEEQQGTNHQVEVWLDKLRDALDDADNLLDHFSFEDKKRQVLSKDKKAKKVRIFFTSSNPLLISFKLAPRVRDIGKKLEALNVKKESLKLANRNLVERVVKQRETHSFIREGDVIGREKEKETLIEMLLNTNMDMKENVSVISIVGVGGLGKTALAQLLYNDKAVQDHFELKMWVCVSDDFDVKTIAKKITDSKTDDMDRVQQELRKKIEGKRYLLVLDDIWNEDRELWLRLKTLLLDGAKGSKIIITTRSEKVAKISDTPAPFILAGLVEEQAWKLFSQLAFGSGKEPENKRLESIGRDILKKCSGVPLAIRSVGGLMYSMQTENDWLNFKEKDLVKIDEERGNSVFQIIKLFSQIRWINGLKSLSKVLQHLTELRELRIGNCVELDMCNDEEGCYSMQWKQLTSLRLLELDGIPKMEYVPDGLQHVTTLERLEILCYNLRCIPEWTASLQRCAIGSCPQLVSLPEWVKVWKF